MPAPAPTELLAEDIRDLRESNHRIATRVDSLEVAVRDLGRDFGNFRAEVASQFGGLRAEVASEIGGLRAEVASEIGGLRAEIGGLRAEVASEIGGLRSEIGGLRAEVASEIGGLRSEIGGLRAEVASEIGGLRADFNEKVGAINTNLEKFQARTDASLRFAGWALTILTPVVIGLIGGAFWITWHAAKLDSRVEGLESRLAKEPAAPRAATTP